MLKETLFRSVDTRIDRRYHLFSTETPIKMSTEQTYIMVKVSSTFHTIRNALYTLLIRVVYRDFKPSPSLTVSSEDSLVTSSPDSRRGVTR